MILFIKILITLLIFLLLITLLIIIIPVKYNVNYKLSDKSYGTIKIKLLCGFLSIVYDNKNEHGGLKILICGFINICIKTKTYEKNKEKETSSKEKKKNKFKLKNINTYFLKKLMGYIIDMIGILKPRIFKIDGAFGFYDPSNTGIACACIPLVTNFFPVLKINLEPVFYDEIMDINIICRGKVSIISAILKTLVFVKEKSIRKVLFG
ncbi:MAG: hypothetical protein PHX70_11550 [Clostridium sp.]|nr:hypothetical protein [Clostridium sp.]